jgi:hypothetical protein
MLKMVLLLVNLALIGIGAGLYWVSTEMGWQFTLGALCMFVLLMVLYRMKHGVWWGDNIEPIREP